MAKKEIKEGYEEILIPRDSASTDRNYTVSVNGINYVMPRGQMTQVPSFVAKEIRRSEKERNKMYERMDEMSNKGNV